MEPSAASRARMTITFVVTAIILVGEFAFLMVVNHLGDGVDDQLVAQAQVSGSLQSWQPGSDTGPVVRAVRSYSAQGGAESRPLLLATDAWASAPTPASFGRVQAANHRAETALGADKQSVERRTMLEDGTPLEFVRSQYRGDAYDFIVELSLAAGGRFQDGQR